MKRVLIFLIIISVGIGIFYYQHTSICRNPLTYDIGDFNAKFGITKDKFLLTIKAAESVWEKGTKKDLFEHRPGGKLKINLIFDTRQETTLKATQSKVEIEGSRNFYDSLLNQYKTTESYYKNSIQLYNTKLSQFEGQLQEYNDAVAAINKRGGATPREHGELEEERKYLQSQKAELEAMRIELNATASRLNALGDRVNDLARSLNIEVDVHNQRFGEAREFDQGDYIDNAINIYQFDAVSDLRLVLAHEFGHALYLNHVENPVSIMYYLMEKQDLKNPSLSKEDVEAFNKRCELRIPKLEELFNLSLLSRYIARFQY